MKVVIVTHYPEDPNAPKGGVEAVSVNLARSLAVFRDLEIHVVTAETRRTTETRERWNGVTVHRLPAPKGSVLLNVLGPWRRLIASYILKLAPDLVHAHDTYGLTVKGIPIPRVFTIHGFIHGDTLVSGRNFAWLRSRIWRRVETAGWAEQPHIISISPYVRERLRGIARGVIHDVDNPIDEGFFHISGTERKGVIFSAAVISPRKNTRTLIESFGKLVDDGLDTELRLAGDVVDPEYGQVVMDTIRHRHLEGRVTLLGRIGTDRVREELAAASVFSLVSLEENSPMGIEEAMAAGLPVITSNRCGMPYMVRHGESGFLVDPLNAADIARRLRQTIEDDGLRRRMGELSRDIARDRFHPAAVARRTREIYYEAVRGVPGQGTQ